jgi:hypothetical protein
VNDDRTSTPTLADMGVSKDLSEAGLMNRGVKLNGTPLTGVHPLQQLQLYKTPGTLRLSSAQIFSEEAATSM